MVHEPGDRLTCRAEGRPVPRYTWSDVTENEAVVIAEGHVLVLSAANNSRRYRCTASNVVRNIVHFATSDIVQTEVSLRTSHVFGAPVSDTTSIASGQEMTSASRISFVAMLSVVLSATLLLTCLVITLIVSRRGWTRSLTSAVTRSIEEEANYAVSPIYADIVEYSIDLGDKNANDTRSNGNQPPVRASTSKSPVTITLSGESTLYQPLVPENDIGVDVTMNDETQEGNYRAVSAATMTVSRPQSDNDETDGDYLDLVSESSLQSDANEDQSDSRRHR